MALPPDRGHLTTEQRHRASINLDALDAEAIIALIADDHEVVLDALRDARRELAAFIEDLVPRLRGGGRLIYVGAGTSGRLGVLDASECPPTFQADPRQIVGIIAGGDRALRRSSEAREDDPEGARGELQALDLTINDTVLGIAAGGTTLYVLGAIAIAHEAGAATGLLTCARRPHPEGCDHLIVLDTGAELLTGSTRLKAGTATKIALNAITSVAFIKLGKTYGNLMVDLSAKSDKLRDRILRILIELSPELSRHDAQRLLDDASGDLKAALVMERLGVNLDTAHTLLAEHEGALRQVIGPPE